MKLKDRLATVKQHISGFIGTLTIRKKTFLFFGLFTLCIITILWLAQIVFLEDFYKFIKVQKIKTRSNDIYSAIVYGYLDEFMFNFPDDDMTIYILDKNADEVAHRSATEEYYYKTTFSMSVGDAVNCRRLALENGGTYTERRSDYDEKMRDYREQSLLYDVKYSDSYYHTRRPHIMEGIIYTRIVYGENEEEYTICISSTLTPLRSTIETLRVQLIYIVIILILLSAILSIIISRQIARPITEITKNAKLLVVGKYVPEAVTNAYTEIDELNMTLNRVSQELNKTEQLRQDLVANVSHDLRTPLTMITGYAEVMRDIPGESTPENLQIIIDEARRLELLVNDLLELSKLQSGTQKLNEEVFIITESVQQAIARLGKFTEQNGYRIEFIYDRNVCVKADALRMSQVIYNLIINALNHAGSDKLVVVKQSVKDDNVIISVKDNGKGIPEDMIKYIWNRYYRLGKSGKRANIGTGLGLSIVSSIMDMHKGKYGVNSTVGRGSEFWISLPVFDEDDDDSESDDLN